MLKFVKNSYIRATVYNNQSNVKVRHFSRLTKTISKDVPLYKKDDDTNLSNYRPISLLPSISKIFEKVLLEQLTTHLDNNHLINNH